MLSSKRKSEIADLAILYSNDYLTEEGIVDLFAIAESEEIYIIHDDYKGAFEGMTVYDDNQFYIHIDSLKYPTLDSGRSRFTFAHELGHALIDNHRLSLLTGEIEPHQSKYLIGNSDSEIELEADYFASCLLMPSESFKKISKLNSKNFSLDSIVKISDHFRTSFMATLIRFAEVGTESIFVTFNKDSAVKWYLKSHDFPNWPFKFKVGMMSPENTVVGDFIRDRKERYTEIEVVDPDDWFYVKGDQFDNYTLYEHCMYVDEFDYVVSILWFGK